MNNKLRWLSSLLFSVLLAACSQTSTPPATTNSGLDATGGSWKTIVLTSSSQIASPAPEANNSTATTAEITQIKSLMAAVTPAAKSGILRWDSSAVIRWNEIARQLVIQNKTNPPMASRVYALLSIAQYDASVTAWKLKYLFNRQAPSKNDASIVPLSAVANEPSYPSDHATIAGASVEVLKYLYPNSATMLDSLAQAHEASRIAGGYNYPSDVTVGDSIGRVTASFIIAEAKTDKSDAPWTGTVPVADSCWYSAAKPPAQPLLPMWGNVQPWLITDMKTVEAPKPPVWNSPEFLAALHEVRQISDTRTQGQIDTAIQWADGGGTYTPPGHWNAIASDALRGRGWSTLREARTMALLNMSMMDAGICCWMSKYECWLIRPSEADTNIRLVVALPNFPSYCSGHSSFSGAASEILGHLMPDRKTDFDGWANSAAISRVYGGIHYRFDSDAGLVMGKMIGDLAIARAREDGGD